MFRGLYTGYTGMITQQQKMDAISNNLANVDTTAYKKDQMVQNSFQEMLTLKIHDPEMPNSASIGKMSLGAHVSQVYTEFEQGSMKQTDEPLNIALQGEGFFKVAKGGLGDDMEVRYTRDGSLNLNQEGLLVTNDGLFVLGEDNTPIDVPLGNLLINKNGELYQGTTLIGKLQLTQFEDPQTLRKEGASLFRATDDSVETAYTGTVEQGFLESSNVSSIQEMIEMIATNRVYEANQKIIQTYDETMEKVVNNVGSL